MGRVNPFFFLLRRCNLFLVFLIETNVYDTTMYIFKDFYEDAFDNLIY